jgi:predicted nuclease of predicted toxin-antitoxin system
MSNTLKFLLDENVRVEVKEFLESKGLSAEYASKGISNGKLASLAKEKGLVLLTRDSDFINTVLFPPKQFSGMVVFRIHPPTAEKLIKGLKFLLSKVKEFKGKVFVVSEESIEIFE